MHSEGSSIISRASNFRIQFKHADKPKKSEFNLESFLNKLNFAALVELEEDDLQNRLEGIDALDLLQAVQNVTEELATMKLENQFLTEFLEKNDPKLLIGLKQRRATATLHRRSLISSFGRSTQVMALSSHASVMTTQSNFTLLSMTGKKANLDYRLNYRAKTEMAEKITAEVEKRVKEMEANAMQNIKMLNTRIEEMRYTCAEAEETARNFELHFLKDAKDIAFLATATERQLERKLRKFVNNWLKNGRALLGTMRLKITTLQGNCAQYRSDLLTKADLSGILRAVDFEQLTIKRDELLQSLEEKNNHLNGLKAVTGKASLAMSEEKKLMASIEIESKRITNKTHEVIKAIVKLENEVKYVQRENDKDLKILEDLHEQIERYDAPSVNEYIERKAEILTLEKEEKQLKRKTNILNMKLINALKRCKRSSNLGSATLYS